MQNYYNTRTLMPSFVYYNSYDIKSHIPTLEEILKSGGNIFDYIQYTKYSNTFEDKFIMRYYYDRLCRINPREFLQMLESELNLKSSAFRKLYATEDAVTDPLTNIYIATTSDTELYKNYMNKVKEGKSGQEIIEENVGARIQQSKTSKTDEDKTQGNSGETHTQNIDTNQAHGDSHMNRNHNTNFYDTPQQTSGTLQGYLTTATNITENADSNFENASHDRLNSDTWAKQDITNKNKKQMEDKENTQSKKDTSGTKQQYNARENLNIRAEFENDVLNKIIAGHNNISQSLLIKQYRDNIINVDEMAISAMRPLFLEVL